MPQTHFYYYRNGDAYFTYNYFGSGEVSLGYPQLVDVFMDEPDLVSCSFSGRGGDLQKGLFAPLTNN